MQSLPPLKALRAFEAAARRGGFAAAAAELGVTSAAVGQQVSRLETWLGRSLFLRLPNRLDLSDAGRALYPEAHKALGDLAAACARLTLDAPRRRLVISAQPSLAAAWLPAVLSRFRLAEPAALVDVLPEDDPIPATSSPDIRLTYGDWRHPGWCVTPLFRDVVTPLCAPEMARRFATGELALETLSPDLFLHTEWGPDYGSNPGWSDWFGGAGRGPDRRRGLRAPNSALILALARAGLGVALGQVALAEEDMASGRLVRLSARELPLGHAYCACIPPGGASEGLARRWLDLATSQG